MDRLGTGGGGPSHHHQQPHSSHRRNTIDETQGKDTRVLSKAKGIMLHIRGCLGSSSPRARWAKRALYACIALYALLSLVAYSSTGLDSHYGDGGGVLSQQLQQQHQQQKQPQPGEPLDLEQRREGRSRGDSVVSSHRRRGRTGAREQQRQEKEEEDEEEEEEEVEETWMFEGEEGEEEDEEEEDGGWDPLAEDYEDAEEEWREDEQAMWEEDHARWEEEEDGDGEEWEEEEWEEDRDGEEEEEDGEEDGDEVEEVNEAMEAEAADAVETDAAEEDSGEEEEEEEEEEQPVMEAAAPVVSASASGARPAAFEQCGVWQEEYMALHRRILSGEAPPKFMVSVVYQGGLADQLVGIVTAFYWALLSGRAFQITVGHQQLPPFEAAFDAPFVNWTRPLDPLYMTRHLYADFKNPKHRQFPRGVNASRFASLYLVNNGKRNKMFREKNLTQLFHDREAIFVGSNRGRSFRLFDNPFHMQQLAAMGLRPETAFGCAFRFLFAPNGVVQGTDAMQMARKFSPPQMEGDVLRIGIQIRVGDFVFKDSKSEGRIKLDDYMDFFECAKEIEEHKTRSNQTKVVWYLISDSKSLREQAQKRFGPEKLWTQTHAVKHMSCGKFDHCDRWNQTSTIADAAADMLALAQADALVLTQKSGFGKVAAWTRIDKWHHIWWPDKPIGKGSTHQQDRTQIVHQRHKCTPNSYVKTEDMADGWSGI